MKEIRYYRIPNHLIEEQKCNSLISDLYFSEIGEIEIERGTIWNLNQKQDNNILAFCTKGSGILMILFGNSLAIVVSSQKIGKTYKNRKRKI